MCQKESQADVRERTTKTWSTSDLCTPIAEILSIRWQHVLRSVWSLMVPTIILLPVPGMKVDNNPHMTTPTRHVRAGIPRRRVIFGVFSNAPSLTVMKWKYPKLWARFFLHVFLWKIFSKFFVVFWNTPSLIVTGQNDPKTFFYKALSWFFACFSLKTTKTDKNHKHCALVALRCLPSRLESQADMTK